MVGSLSYHKNHLFIIKNKIVPNNNKCLEIRLINSKLFQAKCFVKLYVRIALKIYFLICYFFLFNSGQYAFIEASYPRKPNDTAVLRSPSIRPLTGGVCFKFSYHMHGAHVGTLNIYRVIGNSRRKYVKFVFYTLLFKSFSLEVFWCGLMGNLTLNLLIPFEAQIRLTSYGLCSRGSLFGNIVLLLKKP